MEPNTDKKGAEAIATFANEVAEKAALVASGELAPETFVEECMGSIEALQANIKPKTAKAPAFEGLGGMNEGGGLKLPKPDEE